MWTEAEAKTKLCPIVRMNTDGYGYCRANRCMAWRWATAVRPMTSDTEVEGYNKNTALDGSAYWEEPWEKAQAERRRGFCGLAGKVDYFA